MDPMELIAAVVRVYTIVVVVRVVISWLPAPHRENELYRFVFAITDPVLRPVRRILPPVARLDFSPFVVILLLSVVHRLLTGN